MYKEASSFISANENRPHFLIQLFRDLQLISSDGLRHRTLQSIQGVVTDSLANLPINGQGANRQVSNKCKLLNVLFHLLFLKFVLEQFSVSKERKFSEFRSQ